MRRLVAVLCALAAACTGETATSSTQPAAQEEEAAASMPPDPAKEILKLQTMVEAFQYAAPGMGDTMNTTSKGANLFAAWSARRLTWTDLNSVGETKFSLVKKDSEVYRGQRICRGARIIQISVDRFEETKVYRGLFMTRDGDIAAFIAAKSTGDLVEGSWARFCGLVTGNYSYSNSGGGTSHAVQLVGMFDLPENRL